MRGPLRIKALATALLALEQRHKTLQSTFKEQDGVGVQVIQPRSTKELQVINVSAKQDGGYAQPLQQEQTTPFNLASKPG
jgi:hypothetical protein